MSTRRLKPTRRVKCSYDDCPEVTIFEYQNLKEYRGESNRHRAWRCIRHADGARVLSVERTQVEWLSGANIELPQGRYWGSSWAFLASEAYFAAAKDFPVGTRIRVTAEVIFPTEAPR